MKSDRQLKRAYNHYNRKYFNGELPDVFIFWEAASSDLANITEENGVYVMRLDPGLSFSARHWKMAIIHEQAHLKIGIDEGHNKKFHNEMLRLAHLGAFVRLW